MEETWAGRETGRDREVWDKTWREMCKTEDMRGRVAPVCILEIYCPAGSEESRIFAP